MLKFLSLAPLLVAGAFSGSIAWAGPDYAFGLGMESRFQREVNPDYNDMKNMGELYGKNRFWPWSLVVEAGQEGRESSSGSLSVRAESTSLQLWSRYEFREHWSPFLAVGLGDYFDRVETKFQGSTDVRNGTRNMIGFGAGMSTVFWRYLLVELEGRMALLQESRDPVYSVLLRIGLQIPKRPGESPSGLLVITE